MPISVRIALLTAVATLALVLGFCAFLGPRGWMDEPAERKIHHRPVARVGGLVLLTMLALTSLLGWLDLRLSLLEWTSVLGMGLMGTLDDRFDLRARWKALFGLVVALPLAWKHTWQVLYSGVNVTLFGLDIPDHVLVIMPLLIMWYWAIPHAFNLIDGLNGLSLGFSCLLLAALSLGPAAVLGAGAAPLWGVLLVLLLLNYPKARHFMGDAGSLSLGVLFAILVMDRALPWHRGLGFWMMAYPIIDVTMVVAIRLATRKPLGHADRNHMHHWLMERLGGRAWLVTPMLLGLAALTMMRDLDLPYMKVSSALGLIALVLLALRVFADRALLRRESVPLVVLPPEPVRPLMNAASGSHPAA